MGRGKYLKPVLLFFLIVLMTNIAFSKVEDRVVQTLNEGKEARVIIILNGNNTRELQKDVLSKFIKGDFQLTQRFSKYPALAGIIKNKKALEKLKQNNAVKAVYEDKKLYASLTESIPLINAHLANSLGYTGEGIGVCILDTGVDYTHPYLGNASCNISLIGNPEYHVVESAHPYRRNTNIIWTITKPGYDNIAVHFTRIETEPNYDFVYILDQYDNIVQEFSGTYGGLWSISVPGDMIKINLVSDSFLNYWGFKVDQVINGTGESLWQNCGNVINGYDFENGDSYPFDDNGHGTHVAGIVASKHPTYRGVAYNADVIANKVLDASGTGWFSNSAAAIEWCIENKEKYNIKLISMSLGDGGQYNSPANCPTIPPAALIAQAKAQNISTIIASGNEGYNNGISFPACVNDSISVGAVYDANIGSIAWSTCTDSSTYPDKIVCFTNTDEILDVMAPGALITSTVPTGSCEICHPSGFDTIGGTSMATPIVSGLAALHLQKNPTLTPSDLLQKLKETDKHITDPDNGLIFPRVDAINLLDNAILLSLRQGWNLISIPFNPQNKTALFQDRPVYGYNGSWLEPEIITPEKGYWIKSDTSAIIPIQGEQANITLSYAPGWNLVGYPYLIEKNITEIYGNVSVYGYNGTWASYNPQKLENSLAILKAGLGYWVKK